MHLPKFQDSGIYATKNAFLPLSLMSFFKSKVLSYQDSITITLLVPSRWLTFQRWRELDMEWSNAGLFLTFITSLRVPMRSIAAILTGETKLESSLRIQQLSWMTDLPSSQIRLEMWMRLMSSPSVAQRDGEAMQDGRVEGESDMTGRVGWKQRQAGGR